METSAIQRPKKYQKILFQTGVVVVILLTLVTIAVGNIIAMQARNIPSNVIGLDNVMELDFMQGMINCAFSGKKGILEDMNYIEKDWFDGVTSYDIGTGKICAF